MLQRHAKVPLQQYNSRPHAPSCGRTRNIHLDPYIEVFNIIADPITEKLHQEIYKAKSVINTLHNEYVFSCQNYHIINNHHTKSNTMAVYLFDRNGYFTTSFKP